MTSSLRACLAAESWKRLKECGEVATNKGGRGQKTDPKNGDSFSKYAKDKFKVASGLAEQALAISNV